MTNLSDYNKEQLEAQIIVRKFLAALPSKERALLNQSISDYLVFRKAVDDFLMTHFRQTCTQSCYQSKLSACCTREGIITFFADVVLNAIQSKDRDLEKIKSALENPSCTNKCVYLAPSGCLWNLKPIVCQMFLCDPAKEQVFKTNKHIEKQWLDFKNQAKAFNWPDRPVLFDKLELIFINAGYSSPLMYLNNSPGLLRVKKNAQKARKR